MTLLLPMRVIFHHSGVLHFLRFYILGLCPFASDCVSCWQFLRTSCSIVASFNGLYIDHKLVLHVFSHLQILYISNSLHILARVSLWTDDFHAIVVKNTFLFIRFLLFQILWDLLILLGYFTFKGILFFYNFLGQRWLEDVLDC